MGNISELFGKPYRPSQQSPVDSPERQLMDDMQRAGINPPSQIIMDGKIHRFKSGTKGQGKGGDKPGWYIIFGDGVPAGRYGCWRAGIEATNSELKRSHGIGKLRVRRAVKVCFAVACKVIACNIKRWAKAHAVLEGPLQRFLLSVWAHLKMFNADMDKLSLCLRNNTLAAFLII